MAYQNQKVKARQIVTQTSQTQDLGIVSEVPMGDWNATTQYQKLNMVRYNGATYIAKKQSQGVEPTVATGWQEAWQVVAYDGGIVSPDGDYPEMTVGTAINAQNDGTGTNIAEQFSQVESDIQGLRDDITNESHFRGMFNSVAALQAAYPTATPHDYAYIVGGNIYIYENGAWIDSNKPTPISSIPPGNSTPLMDGTGSAGLSGNYSREDHRHPSDTSKANTSGTYTEITAGSANQLSTARAIDGVNFNGSAGITHYGVCNTATTTTIKDVQIPWFSLVAGARVAVKFSNTNYATAPQLRVYSSNTSDGTAKPIYFPVSTTDAKYALTANKIIEFIYDGTNWVMISGDPLAAHPINSLYIAYSSTSPAQLFGGSWTAITGRFLYCNAGTGTGGAAKHYAKLSIGYDNISYYEDKLNVQWNSNYHTALSKGSTDPLTHSYATIITDTNGNENTLPPYQEVYAWRRTA